MDEKTEAAEAVDGAPSGEEDSADDEEAREGDDDDEEEVAQSSQVCLLDLYWMSITKLFQGTDRSFY